MANELYQKTAYALRVGDMWFAGFSGGKGQVSTTKLKDGLCDAKLMWDHKKAAKYKERLYERHFASTIVLITVKE